MTDQDGSRLDVSTRPLSRRGALAPLGGLGLVAAGWSSATDGYAQSASRFSRMSIETDSVFSDGVSLPPSMTGNVASGYVWSLVVGVPGSV